MNSFRGVASTGNGQGIVIEYDMIKTNLIFLYPKGTF